jgi:hypothetical protein
MSEVHASLAILDDSGRQHVTTIARKSTPRSPREMFGQDRVAFCSSVNEAMTMISLFLSPRFLLRGLVLGGGVPDVRLIKGKTILCIFLAEYSHIA